MRKKSNYGQHTIGELMQMLKQTLSENKYLTLDSPVMIADYNMSSTKYDFDLLPCFSSKHHTAGLCLFHSLNKEVTEEVTPKISLARETTEKPSLMKFVERMKS